MTIPRYQTRQTSGFIFLLSAPTSGDNEDVDADDEEDAGVGNDSKVSMVW